MLDVFLAQESVLTRAGVDRQASRLRHSAAFHPFHILVAAL